MTVVMTGQAAEWIRANVWTPAMRKSHRDAPRAAFSCSCQYGASQYCERGEHGRCHVGKGLPSCEAFITDKADRVLYLPAEFAYPTLTATGARPTRAAQVWLADRVCRWACPCPCHSPADAIEPVEFGAVPDVLAVVLSRAGGRCQCERCPTHRKHQGGRCETTNGAGGIRLLAAPPYPGPHPDREPVVTDPAALRAWCPACYDQAISRARKVERDRAAIEGPGCEALF